MPSSAATKGRDRAMERLYEQQQREIAHYLATGEPPNAERPGGTQRGGGAKDAAD